MRKFLLFAFLLVPLCGLGCKSATKTADEHTLKIQDYPDGTKVYFYKNGDRREVRRNEDFSNYVRLESIESGRELQTVDFLQDGTRTGIYKDGRKYSQGPDGNVIVRFNGKIIHASRTESDGTFVTEDWQPENVVGLIEHRVKKRRPSGYVEITFDHHDGSKSVLTSSTRDGKNYDGRRDYANGDCVRIYYHADGEKRRSLEWINKDGSGERITYAPDGETVINFESFCVFDGKLQRVEVKPEESKTSQTRRFVTEMPGVFSHKSGEGPKLRHTHTFLREDGTKEYRQSWYGLVVARPDEGWFPTVIGGLEEFDRDGNTVLRHVTFRLDTVTALPQVSEIKESVRKGHTRIRVYAHNHRCIRDVVVDEDGTETATTGSSLGEMAPLIDLKKITAPHATNPGNVSDFSFHAMRLPSPNQCPNEWY
jgi:hypothetical protein